MDLRRHILHEIRSRHWILQGRQVRQMQDVLLVTVIVLEKCVCVCVRVCMCVIPPT